MKIGVYASARNEEVNVTDWVKSLRDVDCFSVVDNGSSDKTVRKFLEQGIAPRNMLPPTDALSGALNVALGELPDDCDLVMRVDLDERLPEGWREQIEQVDLKYDCPVILRAWFDHMGCVYRHTRIHSRHGFHWELPVHEVLVPEGASMNVDCELTFEHHQDPTKDRSQVLGELQAAHFADPSDMRMVHYLAREYTYRGMWGEAIPLLRVHVASDAFAEERSESWRLLGDAYSALCPPEELTGHAYRKSFEACPTRREGYVAFAESRYRKGDWHGCAWGAERALTITEKSWYFNHPWAWGARPWDLAALAAFYIGDKREAVRCGEEAVKLEPDDERLRTNLEWYCGRMD